MCGVAVRAAVCLKYFGGQLMLFPLRGLLLRAGSRPYKYCWATAPYPYFFSFLSLGFCNWLLPIWCVLVLLVGGFDMIRLVFVPFELIGQECCS
jgi:hypothetical protein